jgi:TolB protein
MRPTLMVLLCACGHSASVPAGAPVRFSIESPAELFAGGTVSSVYNEIRLAISPDGRTVLWGSTDRPGGAGGWDIWMSRRTAGGWSAPIAVSFNSAAKDFDPAYSPDGKLVYFFSDRPGGVGRDDLYRVPVTGDTFGAVEHLGPEVNTPGDEWAPAPSPDGTLLMFASNAPGKKHDLYLARAVGGGFAKAEPVAGAVNAPDTDELDATFLADGRSIVFTRSKGIENDPVELYSATPGPGGYDAGTRLSDAVNMAGGATLGPAIDPREPGVLYFRSKRPEGGAGKLDIYRVRYALH